MIDAAGTSISRPYLCSLSESCLSSFTISASYAAWKKETCCNFCKPNGIRSRLIKRPAKSRLNNIVSEPTRFATPVSAMAILMKRTAEEAASEKSTGEWQGGGRGVSCRDCRKVRATGVNKAWISSLTESEDELPELGHGRDEADEEVDDPAQDERRDDAKRQNVKEQLRSIET